MTIALFALAVFPGREDAWRDFAAACAGARADETADMCHRHGVSSLQMWLQVMPEGNALAVYHCDGAGAPAFMRALVASDRPFDRWYVDQLVSTHALDVSMEPLAPPAELAAAWRG